VLFRRHLELSLYLFHWKRNYINWFVVIFLDEKFWNVFIYNFIDKLRFSGACILNFNCFLEERLVIENKLVNEADQLLS
jgi:hypothetical protein